MNSASLLNCASNRQTDDQGAAEFRPIRGKNYLMLVSDKVVERDAGSAFFTLYPCRWIYASGHLSNVISVGGVV